MIIEVAEIHSPAPGRKVGYLHAADGQKFEVWPDKLDGVRIGHRYEIETKEREYNGRPITSIAKITPAPAPAAAPAADAGTLPAPPPHAGEAEYVGRVLAALIANGMVEKETLGAATTWLRELWRQTPPE